MHSISKGSSRISPLHLCNERQIETALLSMQRAAWILGQIWLPTFNITDQILEVTFEILCSGSYQAVVRIAQPCRLKDFSVLFLRIFFTKLLKILNHFHGFSQTYQQYRGPVYLELFRPLFQRFLHCFRYLGKTFIQQ